MKSCLEEFRNCDVEEIAETYIEGGPQVGTIGLRQDETSQTVNDGSMIHGIGNENVTLTEGNITFQFQLVK